MSNNAFETFIDHLRESGLLDENSLPKALKAFVNVSGANVSGDERASAFRDFLVANSLLTKWQSEKLAMGKFRGFFLDSYVLLDHVGRDLTTTSYAARDNQTGKLVILVVHMPTPGSTGIHYDVRRDNIGNEHERRAKRCQGGED